ncbi:hypothetical protein BASA83_012945 [Batrachochytrium salamandrivorans]|nr:hypothetical protein BASA83_012945 [Batrachochytrium salamandrivorans]
MASLEEILSSLSARLRLLENENESLKVDIQESRAIANRAILEHTITGNAHMSILEPKASLPDKFDGTRKNFRGFINQLELVFQLQASRYDTDRKKIAMLGTLLNGNALSWYNPYLEKPDLFQYDLSTWPRFKEKFCATFGEINQEQVSEARIHIDWNDAALRSQFYHGLSSEIKDALVHFDNPSSVSAAMDMAIRIDNRLFERRQEQQLSHQRPFSSNSSAAPITSRFMNQQQQQRFFDPRQTANPIRPDSFVNLPSIGPAPKSSDDMDIDFVRRGSLSLMEREHRVKQGLCLVCGEAGHQKVACPKSRFKLKSDSSRNIHAIQKEFTKQQNSKEPIQLSSKKQLSSDRQHFNFDNLNMDMMKTVDGGVHECDELDDVARGVLGRLENMLLLPGTLHFGSAIHADTFSLIVVRMMYLWMQSWQTRLNIPLVKIPVPIKLRLADGDSSSMITHRPLPLQLHIGRHVETIGFYVTSLCHGIILGYSWLERHNPQINWESRMVDFGSSYCLENCCVGSTRIQGLGKPPRTSDISPKPSIPEPEPPDRPSDSAVNPNINLSLFKDSRL